MENNFDDISKKEDINFSENQDNENNDIKDENQNNENNYSEDENQDNESNNIENEPQVINEKNILNKKSLIKYTIIFILTSIIYFLMTAFSKISRFKGEVTITDSLEPLKYIMIISIILGVIGLIIIIIDIIKKNIINKLSINIKKVIYTILDWFSILPMCVVITVACFSYFFIITPVEGQSMEPTIKNGEHVFVSYNTKIKAGSVVVLEVNENDNANVYGTSYYIKRVVGMPGDTVEWKNGQLYINGIPNDYLSKEVLDDFNINGIDDFSMENTFYYENGVKKIPNNYVIPEGYYFVMGDNRNSGASHDSRKIGLIPEKNIIGVATQHMKYIIPRGKIQ